MSSSVRPTLAAAYNEYLVSLYSCMKVGLLSGSAIATKKSLATL